VKRQNNVGVDQTFFRHAVASSSAGAANINLKSMKLKQVCHPQHNQSGTNRRSGPKGIA
jgi:hypothetical protein